jgi:hypothetical protein
MIAITRRIFIKPTDATPKPSAIRCRHCGAPMIAERAIYCCESCCDATDDGAAPKVAA